MASAPLVLVVSGPAKSAWQELADIVIDDGDPALADIINTFQMCPRASVALALLLRAQDKRSIPEGIVAESAVYSALQAGPEFAAWREATPVRPPHPDDGGPRVSLDRDGNRLVVTLTRPHRRNALDARMRDELVDALMVARWDPEIAEVVIRGDGPNFSSGGDLNEFGTFDDPITAHLVRLHRHIGRMVMELGSRVVVHTHGANFGSGIEIPAFAGRVTAASNASFVLPEIALGLIPGSGGTASVSARIGRHRTAWLALTRRAIDAVTALNWGLVDEIVDEAD